MSIGLSSQLKKKNTKGGAVVSLACKRKKVKKKKRSYFLTAAHLVFVVKSVSVSCLPDLSRNFLVRNVGTSEPRMPCGLHFEKNERAELNSSELTGGRGNTA